MTRLILNGLIGLMCGAALHGLHLDQADTVRAALAWQNKSVRKALLWASGSMAVLTSLLMWLAVIDVDELPIVLLTGETLIGGAVAGVALGLTGFTPETALAGAGGGRFTESLCAVAGSAAAWALLPRIRGLATGAADWFAPVESTVFKVTLDKPFLLGGGFLAQGCVGLLLLVMALAVRRWLPEPAPAAAPPVDDTPVDDTPAEPVSIEPDQVQEETIVVTLPGEEPVVVDTEAGEDAPEEDEPDETEEPIAPDMPKEEPEESAEENTQAEGGTPPE